MGGHGGYRGYVALQGLGFLGLRGSGLSATLKLFSCPACRDVRPDGRLVKAPPGLGKSVKNPEDKKPTLKP